MKRPFFAAIRNAVYACFCALLTITAHGQTCPFDDGNSSLTVEGVILTRYALGITGAPLVASTGINAADAPMVEASINCPSCGLHITGNPTLTVADATIISRKLAGFSGVALTDGLALGSGTRNTPDAVQSFLLAGCGATGGTVTSITAGSGLTGGTITSSGTLTVNTGVIQSRVSGICVVGSSIRAIAADGTVTCQTDAVGGSGTVTGLLTGIGLSGGPINTVGTVNIEPSFRLPQTCTNGQYTRYNATGSTWDCVSPVAVTNVATGAGLTGGPITGVGTVGLATTQLLPTTACASGQIAKWTGSAWFCAAEAGGPAGPAGPAGPIGPIGPAGTDGINGATGATGTNGTTILSGTTVPAAGLGNSGDFYLRTTNSTLFGPKSGLAWPGVGVSLVGATGATGPSGTAANFDLLFASPGGLTVAKGTWILFPPQRQVTLGANGALVTISVSVKNETDLTQSVDFNLCYSATATGTGFPITTPSGAANMLNSEIILGGFRTVQISGRVLPTTAGVYWVSPCFTAISDNVIVRGGMGFGIIL